MSPHPCVRLARLRFPMWSQALMTPSIEHGAANRGKLMYCTLWQSAGNVCKVNVKHVRNSEWKQLQESWPLFLTSVKPASNLVQLATQHPLLWLHQVTCKASCIGFEAKIWHFSQMSNCLPQENDSADCACSCQLCKGYLFWCKSTHAISSSQIDVAARMVELGMCGILAGLPPAFVWHSVLEIVLGRTSH